MNFCSLFFLLIGFALAGPVLRAQIAATAAASGPVQKLAPLVVSEAPSVAQKRQPAQVTASVTATGIEQTINVLDAEDAAKYLPSVFLRKRNAGDTQAVMATRTWGVSSSARSLVYMDGVLLSALIANNNSLGGPRWGLVTPAEIERIDLMHGPFSAAYPGNSMGAVMEITTRLPEKFEAFLQQTFAFQNFTQYGTRDTYRTSQTAVTAGNRAGKFSFWVSAQHQDSQSQPLSYVTSAAFPPETRGGYAATNKLGAPAQVVGASGLLHTRMTSAKLKLGWDLSPALRAAYTAGFWRNDADARAETYLTNAAGQPTFAGLAGFASGVSDLLQEHSSHSVSLRSATRGVFDFEAIATRYRMDRDRQLSPTTASATNAAAPSFGPAGRAALMDGTGWSTLDLKGVWRPHGKKGSAHVVTFGAHEDRNTLFNPTYTTPDWRHPAAPYSGLATAGNGQTRTQALWAQDVWPATTDVNFTLGARYEAWRAHGGLNVNGATTVRQPAVTDHGFSPKASAAWTVAPEWLVTASVGQAYRFATAAELYQLVSTGTTFTSPNPNLKPDAVLATELKIQRQLPGGRIRVSLFQDDVRNAIIAQFNPLLPGSTQLYSYLANVDHVRARGTEFVFEQSGFIRGLEFAGNVTWLDARTLALSGHASATAPAGSAVGKKLPNIPDARATFVATYRPDLRWAVTLAGRYSGMLWTTLDNTDVNPNTWQGFAAWFVADARLHFRVNDRWNIGAGADNLLNRKYFLFHPFPHRTLFANVKCNF